METDRYGGRPVMVQGGILYEGQMDLYVKNGGTLPALRYQEEILDPC